MSCDHADRDWFGNCETCAYERGRAEGRRDGIEEAARWLHDDGSFDRANRMIRALQQPAATTVGEGHVTVSVVAPADTTDKDLAAAVIAQLRASAPPSPPKGGTHAGQPQWQPGTCDCPCHKNRESYESQSACNQCHGLVFNPPERPRPESAEAKVCDWCRGEGWVTVAEPDVMLGMDTKRCPRCGGTGRAG